MLPSGPMRNTNIGGSRKRLGLGLGKGSSRVLSPSPTHYSSIYHPYLFNLASSCCRACSSCSSIILLRFSSSSKAARRAASFASAATRRAVSLAVASSVIRALRASNLLRWGVKRVRGLGLEWGKSKLIWWGYGYLGLVYEFISSYVTLF